ARGASQGVRAARLQSRLEHRACRRSRDRGPRPPARRPALERRHELHAGARRREGAAGASAREREAPARRLLNDLTNADVAATLDEYAALLELAGANSFSARAYRRAADQIRGLPMSVTDLVRTRRVRELRGIASGIEARLSELVETGHITELEELRQRTAPGLAALGRRLGVAAKRGAEIGAALGIRTAAELRAAADAGRLREVPRIGP